MWQSEPVPLVLEREPHIATAHLDDTGQLQVVMLTGERARVYSPLLDTGPVKTYENVMTMAVLPGGSQGSRADLVLHHVDGTLARYEGLADGPSMSVAGIDAGGPIAAFRQAPFPTPLVAVSSWGRLKVMSFASPEPVFSSSVPISGARLAANDIDGDGQIELMAYGRGLSILRVPRELLFHNGFEAAGAR